MANGTRMDEDVPSLALNGTSTDVDAPFFSANGTRKDVDAPSSATDRTPPIADALFHTTSWTRRDVDAPSSATKGTPTIVDAPFTVCNGTRWDVDAPSATRNGNLHHQTSHFFYLVTYPIIAKLLPTLQAMCSKLLKHPPPLILIMQNDVVEPNSRLQLDSKRHHPHLA